MTPKVLPVPVLCLVTDRRLCADISLIRKVALAVEGGVNMVQLREKDLSGGPLLKLALELKKVMGEKALLIVNERVDVALACGADGVHLGEKGLGPPVVRRIVGQGLLVGRSVHSVEGALEAQRHGADYLIAGTIFPTGSHPGFKPAGTGFLRELSSLVSIPFVGIGGITPSNAQEVIRAGASGVAVISAILASTRPKEAARALRRAVDEAWESSRVAMRGRAP